MTEPGTTPSYWPGISDSCNAMFSWLSDGKPSGVVRSENQDGLEDVLRRHRNEIARLDAEIAAVQGPSAGAEDGLPPGAEWPPVVSRGPPQPTGAVSAEDRFQCRVEEARRLEEEIAAAKCLASAAWLHGPGASIEHEMVRRRHIADVERLEATLAYVRLSLLNSTAYEGVAQQAMPVYFGPNVAGTSVPASSSACGSWLPPATAVWPPEPSERETVYVNPTEVLAERRRKFDDRLFRLWVEDCATSRGVRLHAMDVSSFARMHTDVRDADIQAMYDHFTQRRHGRKFAASFSDREHESELRDFLTCLLDAVYFELGEAGGCSALELRFPSEIDPPPCPQHDARHTHVLVDLPKSNQNDSAPLSKTWIREKILVPRAATSCASSRSSRSAGRSKPSFESDFYHLYAAPQASRARRPLSARAAVAQQAPAVPSDGSQKARPSSAGRASKESVWSAEQDSVHTKCRPSSRRPPTPAVAVASGGSMSKSTCRTRASVPKGSSQRQATPTLFGQQRPPRPNSAKELKQQRVADSIQRSAGLEDSEASVSGDFEVSLAKFPAVNLMKPPPQQVEAALAWTSGVAPSPAALNAATARASAHAQARGLASSVDSTVLDGGRDAYSDPYPPTLTASTSAASTCCEHPPEPRRSTPPRRLLRHPSI